MFDDKFFDDWLDSQAQKVMEKVANGEGIAPEQMMILMLKAQTNHFAHLDVDLRNEMVLSRSQALAWECLPLKLCLTKFGFLSTLTPWDVAAIRF